jgi:hypothetical protein
MITLRCQRISSARQAVPASAHNIHLLRNSFTYASKRD